ncbi:MAG: anhydro-N-acetylmuramic acid kinase [Sphingobacteriaceae bacterium]
MDGLNKNLRQLYHVVQKTEKIAIGLMSGTSLDGLDIALCRFKGNGTDTRVELLEFYTSPYEEVFKQQIWPLFSKKLVDLEMLCLMNALIGDSHAGMILERLKSWKVSPSQVDFIASHGQTIYHSPKRFHQLTGFPNATLQIGDGDHIAVQTGILTISDFRQKHVAAGGEGAPLALYGDILLASKKGENRVLLNIGGIANFTYLPADGDLSNVIATDVGPGNTLIDAACKKWFGIPYDADGQIAFAGVVNQSLLGALTRHDFFSSVLPKTTGPELFNLEYVIKAQKASQTTGIPKADLVSTLSYFTVQAIAATLKENYDGIDLSVFVSGGGARNLYMMQYLKALLPDASVANSAKLGINADAKEAILFALLGNEALSGSPLVINDKPSVMMGKFSFPW